MGLGAAWWFYKIMIVRIMIIYYQHDHRDHNNNLCHNHYLVQSTRTGWQRTMFCAQMARSGREGVAGRAPTKHQNSKTKTLSSPCSSSYHDDHYKSSSSSMMIIINHHHRPSAWSLGLGLEIVSFDIYIQYIQYTIYIYIKYIQYIQYIKYTIYNI